MKKNVLKVGYDYFKVSSIDHMQEPTLREICGFLTVSYKVNNVEYSVDTNMHSKIEVQEIYDEARTLFRVFSLLGDK